MDVQACSDDAGGYLQQNVAADLEGTGDLQGISSTAASAKQSTQQGMLFTVLRMFMYTDFGL